MIRAAAIALVLALSACAKGPCPQTEARNSEGKCVALQESLPPGFVLDTPPPDGYVIDAPSKDQYIADQDAIAEFNRTQGEKEDADYQARRAERAADDRTDRLVRAERDTQQELKRIGDKLD